LQTTTHLCGTLHRIVAIFALAAICGSCISDDPGGSLLNTGDMMPDLSIILNDGTVADNNTLEGKICVIVFFDTTCGDCRREFPHLQQAYESLSADGDNDNISFICVARTQSAEEVSEYWNSNELTMPWSAPGTRAVYSKFALDGIPRTYIFDASGHLAVQFGPETQLSAPMIISALDSLAH